MTTLYVDNIAPNLQSKISAPNLQLPSGSVVQVVTDTLAGAIGNTSASSYLDTGLSITITPKYADSTIIVMASFQIGITRNGANQRLDIRLVNGDASSVLYDARYAGQDGLSAGSNLSNISHVHGAYTVSSTSPISFKVQARLANGSSSEALGFYPKWFNGSKHTITAMEIAG